MDIDMEDGLGRVSDAEVRKNELHTGIFGQVRFSKSKSSGTQTRPHKAFFLRIIIPLLSLCHSYCPLPLMSCHTMLFSLHSNAFASLLFLYFHTIQHH